MELAPKDLAPMELALDEARAAAARGEVPVGAVVLAFDGTVLARAGNAVEARHDASAHAELLALRAAAAARGATRLTDCDLVVTLEPCPMCAEAIMQARVSKVVFCAFDQLYGAMGSAFDLYVKGRPFPLPAVEGGLMQQECRRLVQEFFKGRRAENNKA